jgi:LemA protein
MKKNGLLLGCVIGGIVLVLTALIMIWGIGVYNNIVTHNENVTRQWHLLENEFQKKSGIIPDLTHFVINTQKFDSSEVDDIIQKRNKLLESNGTQGITGEAGDVDDYQYLRMDLDKSVKDLLIKIENYPELKANENFQRINAHLNRADNRITVERRKFVETVNDFNTSVKTFPNSIIAGIFGFSEKKYSRLEN